MSCEQEAILALRAAGRRCTVPRIKVASALRHADGHLTAESIYALILESDPRDPIALSTIYRTLETLKEIRVVAETSEGPRATYEWVDRAHPHHHLSCRRCGRQTALDHEVFDALAATIRTVADFEAHLDHLVVSGTCSNCRRELALPAAG